MLQKPSLHNELQKDREFEVPFPQSQKYSLNPISSTLLGIPLSFVALPFSKQTKEYAALPVQGTTAHRSPYMMGIGSRSPVRIDNGTIE